MNKIEFMRWFEERKDALAMWTVSIDEENMSDYVIGCFFLKISQRHGKFISIRGEESIVSD